MLHRSSPAAEYVSILNIPKDQFMTSHTRKLIIETSGGLVNLDLAAVWEYRDLLYFLVWRDIKVRYKQTAIGISWVVLQPLITILIFTVIFGYLAKMPSDGVWYPVFTLAALLPWTYFSQALTRSASSLASNANMISKIYFPRILLPLSAVIAPLIDLALCLIVLLFLLVFAGIPLTLRLFALPGFIFLAVVIAAGLGLFISSTNVKYRDVGHAIPFVVQIWMFLSPIVYPVSLIPEQWRLLYSLNPMVGVIEGFRWSLLGKAEPDPVMMVVSYLAAFALVLTGIVYFKKLERQFADVI